MRHGDVTMSDNRQMADFKGTFLIPHGRQDAQVKQVSRTLNEERLVYSWYFATVLTVIAAWNLSETGDGEPSPIELAAVS